MPKLRSYVHVTDDQGHSHEFGPNDPVPAWAQAKIVNPDAWEDAPAAPVADEPEVSPAPKKAPARRGRKTEAAEA